MTERTRLSFSHHGPLRASKGVFSSGHPFLPAASSMLYITLIITALSRSIHAWVKTMKGKDYHAWIAGADGQLKSFSEELRVSGFERRTP
jgi:hypothetical protein